MVTVTLKNQVSVDKIEFAGDYLISETVNGEPSWKNGEYAIWCNPHGYRYGKWKIGYWNKLGENDAEFTASNDYEGLHNNLYLVTDNRLIWKYTRGTSPGKGWITSNYSPLPSKDVIISCSGAFDASAFVSKAAWGAIESIKDLVHTILHYSKKLHRLIHSLSDENTSLKKISCPHLNSFDALHSKGCYFFDQHAHTPTWQMAQDYCTSLGPDYGLAEIYDEETHELIRNHGTNIGSNFDWWLGAVSSDKGQDGVLRRPATQVKWIWQRTGKELKYTNWADDMGGYLLGGDCLQMWRTQSLKWDDVDCNDGGSENKPICQKFA